MKNPVIWNVKFLVYAKYRSFIENKRSPVLRFFNRCVYCHTSCLQLLQSYFIYSTYDLYLNFLFFSSVNVYLIISTSKHDLPIRRTSAMSKVVRQHSRWQLHGLSRFLGSESYQTTRRFVPISRPKLHRWVRLSLGTTSVVLRRTVIPRIIWRIYAFRRTTASTASRLGTRNVVEWHDLKARTQSHSRLGSGA